MSTCCIYNIAVIALDVGVKCVLKFVNISLFFAPLRDPSPNFNNNESPSPKNHT